MRPLPGLTAFIDDSIAQTGDRRLVLAGYLTRDDIWDEFRAAWAHELSSPPALDSLHMVEAANFRGPLKHWSEAQRDAKVAALARLVSAYQLFSFECTVSVSIHREMFGDDLPHGFAKPYNACAQGAVITLARYVYELGGREPIQFVFDTQQGAAEDIIALWTWMKQAGREPWRKLLGPLPRFADDQDEAPLQAADMLAWHRRRAIESAEAIEARPIMAQLLSSPHLMTEIDRTTLETITTGLRRIPGLAALRSKAQWRDTRQAVLNHVAAGKPPPRFGPRTVLIFLTLRDTLTGFLRRPDSKAKSRKRRRKPSI